MILVKGIGTSSYVSVGRVKKIKKKEELLDIKGGEIVVMSRASRDMLSYLRKAAGVVTDYGGITSHAAIVLRELKIPCIVGTGNATEIIIEDTIITVDGKTGNIYQGFIEIEEVKDLFEVYNPATHIKVNLNIPEIAAEVAHYADGVGSIRIENTIIRTGKHPQKLLEENKLTETIVKGIEGIVNAFYPKPVWFRTFDILSDELTHLDGATTSIGEKNPLIGYRGIINDLKNQEILKAEFQAVREVYEQGYTNIAVKIPFIRDISEYVQAKNILKSTGLKPHKDIKIGISVETPSSACILDDFIREGIDFVSIGMSDLTMAMLAVDRRSVKVAKHYNLLHPAVLNTVEAVIKKCAENSIESCVCGYAATNEAIVKKLVEYGITSISTNPDQILKMRKIVEKVENKIINKVF
ncbi:MAG: PEP-utilizing enzyme [Methanobacteriaceae archaeon]|nr:PEP-utilizing enzyme [Methanobacteriaceae archaeon]